MKDYCFSFIIPHSSFIVLLFSCLWRNMYSEAFGARPYRRARLLIIASDTDALGVWRLCWRRVVDGVFVAHAVCVGGADEGCEERVRGERLRFVFGMELTAKKPRMDFARQLDHLDEAPIGRLAAKDQTGSFQ